MKQQQVGSHLWLKQGEILAFVQDEEVASSQVLLGQR